jgi:hypothetical protein
VGPVFCRRRDAAWFRIRCAAFIVLQPSEGLRVSRELKGATQILTGRPHRLLPASHSARGCPTREAQCRILDIRRDCLYRWRSARTAERSFQGPLGSTPGRVDEPMWTVEQRLRLSRSLESVTLSFPDGSRRRSVPIEGQLVGASHEEGHGAPRPSQPVGSAREINRPLWVTPPLRA